MALGSVGQDILHKLTEAFQPEYIEVIDESSHHQGHVGARPGGQSHFRVKISSPAFSGKTRIEQHRLIHSVLTTAFNTHVHALAIEVRPVQPPT